MAIDAKQVAELRSIGCTGQSAEAVRLETITSELSHDIYVLTISVLRLADLVHRLRDRVDPPDPPETTDANP